jgi:predicted RNase H-like HicB family nuclease
MKRAFSAQKWSVAFDQGSDGTWGAVVLDLDGCSSGGETFAQARANVREAIAAHLDVLGDMGMTLPTPIGIDALLERATMDRDLFEAMEGALVLESDAEELRGKATRVQITMNENLLARVDQSASRLGQTRSGFLAEGARRLIEQAG